MLEVDQWYPIAVVALLQLEVLILGALTGGSKFVPSVGLVIPSGGSMRKDPLGHRCVEESTRFRPHLASAEAMPKFHRRVKRFEGRKVLRSMLWQPVLRML
jgi:hypothetical protein